MGNKLDAMLASSDSAEMKARKAFKVMDRDGDEKLKREEWKQFGIMLFKREEEVKGKKGTIVVEASPHVPLYFCSPHKLPLLFQGASFCPRTYPVNNSLLM